MRVDAAYALREARNSQTVPGLVDCLLGDGYWSVRWSATEALRAMRYYRSRTNLQFSMREDANRHVCLAAKRALVKRDKGSDKTINGCSVD